MAARFGSVAVEQEGAKIRSFQVRNSTLKLSAGKLDEKHFPLAKRSSFFYLIFFKFPCTGYAVQGRVDAPKVGAGGHDAGVVFHAYQK